MVKVYHGNVIYRMKMCFSWDSASKLYQSLAVKWLWRMATSACLTSLSSNPLGYVQHLSVRSPSLSCPGNECPKTWFTTTHNQRSVWKRSFNWTCWAHCTSAWFTPPCGPLAKQVSGPRSRGSMHLTAWPLCLNCLGGQARTCPIWCLWATSPRKCPRRAPRYIFDE